MGIREFPREQGVATWINRIEIKLCIGCWPIADIRRVGVAPIATLATDIDTIGVKIAIVTTHEWTTVIAFSVLDIRIYIKIGTGDIASVNNSSSRLSLVTHYMETDGALGAGSDTVTYTC